jgi:hypothetical protein
MIDRHHHVASLLKATELVKAVLQFLERQAGIVRVVETYRQVGRELTGNGIPVVSRGLIGS